MKEGQRYFIQPGYIFVSRDHYLLYTVLGSCVSVCLWDHRNKFGGMNHYIFAKAYDNQTPLYGNVSITHMLRLMKKLGSKREDLQAHIIGGAHNPSLLSSPVGEDNINMAEEILLANKIQINIREIRGEIGRKAIFDTLTGQVIVHEVQRIRKEDWYDYTHQSFDS